MKVKKVFSWDNFHERQIALRVAYIGWNMKGFIAQEGTKETVEEYLFAALERARLIKDRNNCSYSLCGRTDAGVSGIGNVVSVRVRSVCPEGVGAIKNEKAPTRTEEMDYLQILNGILPKEIRITDMAYVPVDFNARFNCTSRSYRYFFHRFNKDIERMKAAAAFLIGEHDFRCFCKFAPNNTSHCVRVINRVEFGEVGDDVWFIEVEGSGFIWHQIRCTVAVLFLVGEGLEEPEIVKDLLDVTKYPGRPQYGIADPEPLVFWRAEYASVEWIKPAADATARIHRNFGEMLRIMEMRTAVMRCFAFGDRGAPSAPKSYTKIASLQMSKSVEQLIAEYQAAKPE